MSITKIFVPLFLFIFLPKILRGQEESDSSTQVPKIMVKFSPFDFVNFFEPTLAVSVEHRLIGKHYLEHEFGYIYTNPIKLPTGTHGLRYQLGYHFVYKQDEKDRKYWGVQCHYRQLFGEVENYVWRKDFSYQQNIKYQNKLYSYGFTALWGSTHFWGKSSRWFTDFQVGMGLSWKPLKIENYPSDAENPKFVSWIYNSQMFTHDGTTLRNGENPVYVNFLFALKIGYLLY
jgi:hypothetical protein